MTPERTSFKDYYVQWLKRADNGEISEGNFERKKKMISRYAVPVIGDLRLAAIKESDIDNIFSNKELFSKNTDSIEAMRVGLDDIFDSMIEENPALTWDMIRMTIHVIPL